MRLEGREVGRGVGSGLSQEGRQGAVHIRVEIQSGAWAQGGRNPSLPEWSAPSHLAVGTSSVQLLNTDGFRKLTSCRPLGKVPPGSLGGGIVVCSELVLSE